VTICLSMILKNEGHVIERCLASARQFVDSFAIVVDDETTDDTEEKVRRSMRGLPGAMIRKKWRGFGAARTTSLAIARGRADYALVLDADEVLSGFVLKAAMTEPAYALWMKTGPKSRSITHRLLRLDKPWRYEEEIHEYPTFDAPFDETLVIDTLHLESPQDGARSKDPKKLEKDLATIERVLRSQPENTRMVFYRARTLHEMGRFEEAAKFYEQRATMGPGKNWEEPYISLLEAGRCFEALRLQNKAVDAYYRAHNSCQLRPEATRELARIFAWRASVTKPVGLINVET
jgi:glycosyltransferase involved in cell wall biosynthesis